MAKQLSARELVNAHLGKTISPKGQAVIDSFNHLREPSEDDENDQDTREEDVEDHAEDAAESEEAHAEAQAAATGPLTRKTALLQLIDEKLTAARSAKSQKRKPTPSTRAEANRANAQKSTGPKTPEGKAAASTNSLKHGFFANIEKLNPHDSPLYQETHSDLRMGLQPDGPVEEQLIRELAMLSTRLQRLESAEYALLAGNTEEDPSDARAIALAFQKSAPALEQLHKIEVHLRRAYNRTWDRLSTMQKERHKLSLEESLKRSQVWLTYYREKAESSPRAHTEPIDTTPAPTILNPTPTPATPTQQTHPQTTPPTPQSQPAHAKPLS